MTDQNVGKGNAAAETDPDYICWVCQGTDLRRIKTGNLQDNVDPSSFQITDADYGRTGDIYACGTCGFRMCPNIGNVLSFYEEMEDLEYENTRAQRKLQSERLIALLHKHKPQGKLLDVGAGSGILVEAALDRGYDAQGVEPSRNLQKEANRRGLPVSLGVLGEAEVTPPFDAVSLIDVIEHVPNPVEVLSQIHSVLGDDGVLLIVTPDVSSFAARTLKWKWWHYRIAHIGYFNRETLERAVNAAGFDIVEVTRPTWYFPASYLAERVSAYLPKPLRFRLRGALGKLTVPLNLFDSLCFIVRKRPTGTHVVKDR